LPRSGIRGGFFAPIAVAPVRQPEWLGYIGGMSLALCVHPTDNVATLLDDSRAGSVEILGLPQATSIDTAEVVARGHKIALVPFAAGQAVVKFGVPIGHATTDIAAGAWVHTHNCASRLDARSATLDRHTGAPTDTRYE
jgi:hypothetical protein